ncbi:MAG: hypothetical protein HOG94_00600, partial [Nitrospinaceae bacterium]|nr:hypothetical protein [Nitrospinaceae bacterium]
MGSDAAEVRSNMKLNNLLDGAIDVHIHSGPDSVERWGDTIDIARLAIEMGMRGVVFKDHFRPTTHKALLTSKAVPGLEIFSLHACNHPCGGLSYRCVMMSIGEGAKVIQMPTLDSVHQHARETQGHLFTHFLFGTEVEPISLYNPGTQDFTDDLQKILDAVKKYDLVLSNGHISPVETIDLFEKAIAMGIKPERCMVEHPNSDPAYKMDHMKAIAALGAYLNISYNAINPMFAGRHPKEGADIVKEVGAKQCTIITDGGQHTSPGPAEGMRVFCNMFMQLGVSRD